MTRPANFVPYHSSSFRSSKRQFLLDAGTKLPSAACPNLDIILQHSQYGTDRRTFLKYGVGGVVASGVALPATKVDASPLAALALELAKSVAVGVFAEGCIWFLKEVVVPWFRKPAIVEAVDRGPDHLKQEFIEVKQSPTSDPFHNYFATQGKRGFPASFYFEPRPRDDYGPGIELGLGEHVRRIDLNALELDQMRRESTTERDSNGRVSTERYTDREHFYGMPLVGDGLRLPFNNSSRSHRKALTLANELYAPTDADGNDAPYEESEVIYTQKLRDSNRGSRNGLGVKRGSKFQYLITD